VGDSPLRLPAFFVPSFTEAVQVIEEMKNISTKERAGCLEPIPQNENSSTQAERIFHHIFNQLACRAT
jgi:hypothetical protein